MLAIYGFSTIAVFLLLIMTKRLSVITALVAVPIAFAFIAGFNYTEIGNMALSGIKQVAPTGILLMFAVLYFSVMLDAGLFDPVIAFIVRSVKGDPLKVIAGTAILTMIVHLDGDGTATFMIVLSAFLPIYKKLGISRLILAGIVALSVGPMHLVPWSGTSVRAMSTLNTDALHLFNPNIPAMLGGILWVLVVAYIFGSRERKRLGIIRFDYNHEDNFTDEQKALKRPRLIFLNAALTILSISILLMGAIPPPALFVIASIIALMINYSKLTDQHKVMKAHGANIFLVSSMIFAAGVYSGILTGSKMVEAMASGLVHLIPEQYASFIPVITAVISMPASILFTPDAYYFGVVPVLSEACYAVGR